MENLPATFGQILEQFHNTFDPSPILDDSAKHAFYEFDEDDPTFLANNQNHKNGTGGATAAAAGSGATTAAMIGGRAPLSSSSSAPASSTGIPPFRSGRLAALAAARSERIAAVAAVKNGGSVPTTPRSRFSRLGRDSLCGGGGGGSGATDDDEDDDRREDKDEREDHKARGGFGARRGGPPSPGSTVRDRAPPRTTTGADNGGSGRVDAPAIATASAPEEPAVIDLSSYEPHGPYDSLLERVAMMTVQMERMRDEFEYMRSENASLLENLALAGEAVNLPLDSFDDDDEEDDYDDEDDDFDDGRGLDYRTF